MTSRDLNVLIDKFVDTDRGRECKCQAINRISCMGNNKDWPMPEIQPVRSAANFDKNALREKLFDQHTIWSHDYGNDYRRCNGRCSQTTLIQPRIGHMHNGHECTNHRDRCNCQHISYRRSPPIYLGCFLPRTPQKSNARAKQKAA